MISTAATQFSVVFRMEIRGMLRDRQNVKALLLLPPVLAASLWPHTPSPLLPPLIAAFLIAEPRMGNFLFTSPREGETLFLLPRSWKEIVAAKNAAAALYVLALFLLLSIPADYFSPSPAPLTDWGVALGALGSILFPLFHLANRHAVEHPRRQWTWSIGDLAEGIIFLVTVGVSALPISIAILVGEPLIGASVIIPAGAWLWIRVTIPATANACSSADLLERAEK